MSLIRKHVAVLQGWACLALVVVVAAHYRPIFVDSAVEVNNYNLLRFCHNCCCLLYMGYQGLWRVYLSTLQWVPKRTVHLGFLRKPRCTTFLASVGLFDSILAICIKGFSEPSMLALLQISYRVFYIVTFFIIYQYFGWWYDVSITISLYLMYFPGCWPTDMERSARWRDFKYSK